MASQVYQPTKSGGAQQIGGAVGTAVGAYFGGPGGAMKGYGIGSGVGSMADKPQKNLVTPSPDMSNAMSRRMQAPSDNLADLQRANQALSQVAPEVRQAYEEPLQKALLAEKKARGVQE